MIPKPDISPLLPSEKELSERGETLRVELAGESAISSPRQKSGRRRGSLWRWLLGFIVISLLGVGAATAAGVFSAEEMQIDGGMGCYSEASLQPEVISIIGPREDPVAACIEMWRKGEMYSGARRAPKLVACTGPGQPVRVIPGVGSAACEKLGLVALPADYPPAARRWRPPAD